ncbi:Transmembrane 9 superfamily protein member 1 [Musa troglodytarum]|uniref:Transmembrane 9 superfamily member n=1 Tax=Musa troglodytarum TaxID=320322 RepID=A0A9E7GCG3_9LILI|nr:Transmembrane 9 superfamily protein member 1 [Musa troglodytarum]
MGGPMSRFLGAESSGNTLVVFRIKLPLCLAIVGVASDASGHRYKNGDPVPLYAKVTLGWFLFTYSVKWKETSTPFEKRMEKYSLTPSQLHHLQIHWFSILNSCVTILLLIGFPDTILMRVLKNDFVNLTAKYVTFVHLLCVSLMYTHDEESTEEQEETGWKSIHGDVFRFPKNLSLFASCLGSGTQLFALLWGHRIYTIYSILFIVFIILLIVTAIINIALTYFQLASEDHEWWWRSFLCGGSTGLYVYAYCLNYYYALSDMSGFMQTSFFFSYMACICYGFFLMLGMVGFRTALLFVHHIYRFIKCE